MIELMIFCFGSSLDCHHGPDRGDRDFLCRLNLILFLDINDISARSVMELIRSLFAGPSNFELLLPKTPTASSVAITRKYFCLQGLPNYPAALGNSGE